MAVIVVAEDDADVAAAIELNLTLEGHEVHVCTDGDKVLELVRKQRPELLVLDVVMPGADGLTIARAIRADSRISDTAILMLTARTASSERLAGFDAGADDYIIKPFDTAELLARVRSTLRRATDMREISPLTGLPGNFRISHELDRRVAAAEQPFAVVYTDLNHFKSYNDHYGFLRGDQVIRLTAEILVDTVRASDEDGFVGHVGGDDFVVICTAEVVEDLCRRIIERFDREVRDLYDPEDLAHGFIETVDRRGETHRYPPVGIALGIATNAVRALSTRWEAAEIATEMKRHAKRHVSSAYEMDRRRA